MNLINKLLMTTLVLLVILVALVWGVFGYTLSEKKLNIQQVEHTEYLAEKD